MHHHSPCTAAWVYDCQVSGLYFWLQETPELSNQIPFQNSASIFCSIHLIFSISRHISFQSMENFFFLAVSSAQNTKGFPGNKRLANWKCGWSRCLRVPNTSSVPAVTFGRHPKAELSTVPGNFINGCAVLSWLWREADCRLSLPAGQVSHLAVVRMVISCTVETGWTWLGVSARSPLSHLCGLAGWVLRSAWFHLGTCCGLLLTIWVCKMMPFKHDWDRITPGLYVVWFVCKG